MGCRGTDRDNLRSVYHDNWMELPPIPVHNNKCGNSTLPAVEHPVSCRHRLRSQQSTEVTSPWFYQRTVRIITNISKFSGNKKKLLRLFCLLQVLAFCPRYFYEVGNRRGVAQTIQQFVDTNNLEITCSHRQYRPTVTGIHISFNAYRFLYPSMIDKYFRN